MTQIVQDREEEAELISLVCDLMILSQSDYFVGTYSSNGSVETKLAVTAASPCTRPVKATFSERQNKDQFTFQGARSLIVGAYSEALQVKEFARKYFSKDLDLTTKSALEEDYSRNYLPFKDLTRKIQALVDAIYSQSHDNLTILGDLVQKRIQKLQEHVIDWYDRHVGSVEGERVYVASDDLASVIPEAHSKYPSFTFLYLAEDKKPLKDMTQTVKGRETEEELVSLVCDLMILSRSDYFIGTYSSNIGRLVVQLMHSVDDATFKTRSVDQQMSFRLGIPLYYRSTEAHFGQEGELSFNAGERIVLQPFVESPAYKGFGTNRAGHYGSFPMYKVEKILPPVPYLALSNKV
ncbi:alpha-(1,6)-fucosyltransferase-like [Clavelina lepadiformis]|uniref:alpha-(1,6)-fucosyltransferase-like n=1 Tax=Clavelina lepadiformis TaxID=159417 RepID=UPI004041816D